MKYSQKICMSFLVTVFSFFVMFSSAMADYQYVPGLGISGGATLPFNEDALTTSYVGGFYVDIPLIQSFHITPSSEIYTLNLKNSPDNGIKDLPATDISLAFKFIVPLRRFKLFFGFPMGITHMFIPDQNAADIRFHAGGMLGGSVNLISNIDFFVQSSYKIIFTGEIAENSGQSMEIGNINSMRIAAGLLFRFIQ